MLDIGVRAMHQRYDWCHLLDGESYQRVSQASGPRAVQMWYVQHRAACTYYPRLGIAAVRTNQQSLSMH